MAQSTSFTLESQLVEPVTAWLEGAGYRVELEVPILGRRADLLGAVQRLWAAFAAVIVVLGLPLVLPKQYDAEAKVLSQLRSNVTRRADHHPRRPNE